MTINNPLNRGMTINNPLNLGIMLNILLERSSESYGAKYSIAKRER